MKLLYFLLGVILSFFLYRMLMHRTAAMFAYKSYYTQAELEEYEKSVLKGDIIVAEELYKARKVPKNFNPCSCVSYARYKAQATFGPIGMAKNLIPNSQSPEVGAIVITSESRFGHQAYVTEVWADEIVVEEANYQPCKVTKRTIKRDSPLIRGYYIERQVW